MIGKTVAQADPELAPPHPSLQEATGVWLRIGLLSFGGPAGQIALMHRELVEERRWISESRFLHALNFCMLIPGPEAQQLATYIGWLLHGTRGGIIAGTLFVLPGFLTILLLSTTYALLQDNEWVASLFFGLKSAVLAIVLEAVIRLGRRALKNWIMLGLAAAAFVSLFVFNLPFPVVILSAGVFGFFGARAFPVQFAALGHRSASRDLASVIDKELTVVPSSAGRLTATGAIWGSLWVAPLVLIVVFLGWSNVLTTLWAFFSQMALVTFGGAYAVLTYVAQEAVQNFGWLQPGEMVDGLALAETTPGPLVLVLSFVGFLAAFRAPAGMDPLVAGLLGAFVTAWVTFIPCFLWIFLGAPYVERLRSNKPLSSALAAITAAAVGVILNLGAWFGLHVLFGEVETFHWGPISIASPAWTSLDIGSLALTCAAGVSLFLFRFGVVKTMLFAGLAGVLLGALPFSS